VRELRCGFNDFNDDGLVIIGGGNDTSLRKVSGPRIATNQPHYFSSNDSTTNVNELSLLQAMTEPLRATMLQVIFSRQSYSKCEFRNVFL
jgi:hypothetical protein